MIKHTTGIFSVGTSNIVLPGNKQTFPTEYKNKSRLNYYSSLFNSVELNSTFYRTPMLSTFKKWALDVPENFTFTVKVSKDITHIKDLNFELTIFDKFLQAADGLGDKKGCLLLQFPGKITLAYYNRVQQILELINQQEISDQWRIAIEFRNASWYVRETHELLDEYGASLVLHDKTEAKNFVVNKNAAFIYLRFHGPSGDYKGSYTNEFLQLQGKKITDWLNSGLNVYAYFNNTMGNALDNALELKLLVNQPYN